MTASSMELFAITAPGLEEVTADELRDLRARRVRVEPGGVTFQGDLGLAFRANLWLRTATRVLWRVERFSAPSLQALSQGAQAVDWPALLGSGVAVEVRASCTQSRLMHSGAVAERVATAIGEALGSGPVCRRAADRYGHGVGGEPCGQPIDLLVRLHHDQCRLSVDTSGASLSRRGYRLESAKAPLRETLAAALLRLTAWRGEEPLWDPLCGAGTLPIEAALVAARIPPGAGRTFALERLPGFDPEHRVQAFREASARRRAIRVPIRGTDRDAGAVATARRNAERAGLAEEIRFERAPLGALDLRQVGSAGLVVSNPPYGRRIGDPLALRDLYATLGARLAASPGWRVALVSAEPRLFSAVGIPLVPLGPPVVQAGLRLHFRGSRMDR